MSCSNFVPTIEKLRDSAMAAANEVLTQCQSCGTLARAGARFCDSCGGALSDAARVPVESKLPPTVSARGARRHLTVLFCDLVGSTSIAAKLDPEEWRELVAAYHRTTARAVDRFGGSVAKYLGDGVMAYFGWPEAHGDDPERAVRAGLAILEAIFRLNEGLTDIKLAARVGIDSGIVVVGTGGSNELEIFGETPNIAARVQAAAARDMVLITEATHLLVSGLFVVEQRGAHTLKGIERPTATLPRCATQRRTGQAPSSSGDSWTDSIRWARERVALGKRSLATSARW